MKTQFAIALTAANAAAAGTQALCNGYFSGLIALGWDCTFEDSKLKTCTKTGGDFTTVVGDDVALYTTACKKADDTLMTMAQPTATTCDAWRTANSKAADYVATDTDKTNVTWIEACYKAGALNLTVLGAAAVAAIAALAF